MPVFHFESSAHRAPLQFRPCRFLRAVFAPKIFQLGCRNKPLHSAIVLPMNNYTPEHSAKGLPTSRNKRERSAIALAGIKNTPEDSAIALPSINYKLEHSAIGLPRCVYKLEHSAKPLAGNDYKPQRSAIAPFSIGNGPKTSTIVVSFIKNRRFLPVFQANPRNFNAPELQRSTHSNYSISRFLLPRTGRLKR